MPRASVFESCHPGIPPALTASGLPAQAWEPVPPDEGQAPGTVARKIRLLSDVATPRETNLRSCWMVSLKK